MLPASGRQKRTRNFYADFRRQDVGRTLFWLNRSNLKLAFLFLEQHVERRQRTVSGREWSAAFTPLLQREPTKRGGGFVHFVKQDIATG
jgi:hypothetical protein